MVRAIVVLGAFTALVGCATKPAAVAGCALAPNPVACAVQEAIKRDDAEEHAARQAEIARDPIRASFEDRNFVESISDAEELDRWCDDQRQQYGLGVLSDSVAFEEVCERLLPMIAAPKPASTTEHTDCDAALTELEKAREDLHWITGERDQFRQDLRGLERNTVNLRKCHYRSLTDEGHTAVCIVDNDQAQDLKERPDGS